MGKTPDDDMWSMRRQTPPASVAPSTGSKEQQQPVSSYKRPLQGLPIHYVLQESVPSLIYGRDIAMFPERWLFSDWSISLIFIALLNGIF